MRRAQSGTADIAGSAGNADIAGSAGNADNAGSVIGGESLTSKQLADGSSCRAKLSSCSSAIGVTGDVGAIVASSASGHHLDDFNRVSLIHRSDLKIRSCDDVSVLFN